MRFPKLPCQRIACQSALGSKCSFRFSSKYNLTPQLHVVLRSVPSTDDHALASSHDQTRVCPNHLYSVGAHHFKKTALDIGSFNYIIQGPGQQAQFGV